MTSTAKLTINLKAIADNFAQIQTIIGANCKIGPAIKANAYGLGMEQVAKKLNDVSDLFFIATPDEALALRSITKKPIALLNGMAAPPDFFITHHIWPVLGGLEDISKVSDFVRKTQTSFPCLIQIDTGMNRLGLNRYELEKILNNPNLLQGLDIHYIMSHFISSENHPCPLALNQYDHFLKSANQIGLEAKRSIANSGGIFRDARFHMDLVRPGASLYGINPTPHTKNPMKNVITLEAMVLKTQTASKGETVGYDATYTLDRPSKLATISFGYADGFHRALSNRGKGYWQGSACPVIGRVSMDLIVLDITDLPQNIAGPCQGDWIELVGENYSIDDLAKAAGTNGYEMLCSLSNRAHRHYQDF